MMVGISAKTSKQKFILTSRISVSFFCLTVVHAEEECLGKTFRVLSDHYYLLTISLNFTQHVNLGFVILVWYGFLETEWSLALYLKLKLIPSI